MYEDSLDRLSKFFSVPQRATPYSGIAAEALQPLAFENAPRLADLLEYAVRGMGLQERPRSDADVPFHGALPERLIEELTTAQEQMRAKPPVLPEATLDGTAEFAVPVALETPAIPHSDEASYDLAGMPDEQAEEETAAPLAGLDPVSVSAEEEPAAEPEVTEAAYWKAAASPLNRLKAEDWIRSQAAGVQVADRPKAIRHRVRKLPPWIRLKEWNRRRLALLSHFHRHLFDGKTEQFLFYKTPSPNAYRPGREDREKSLKPFRYEGPMPKLLLDWTLSALPCDLKRYAFIDFRAGNGRTLLFAARHHFEYAAGYAFDAGSTEVLEMNLARYPRTRLACRDVRALRGDRDGVIIPSQPAVLFFPDSLSGGHLDIILDYVSASLRASPRPIYLIFENAGREQGREQMTLFEKVRLPLFNRGKAFLFAPVPVAVYRSKTGIVS